MRKITELLLITFISCNLISCKHQIEEDASPVVSETFSETWKYHAGEGKDSLWMNVDYDDTAWKEITSTQLLEEQNLSFDNGYGWYRKIVQFSDNMKEAVKRKGGVVLHLGKMGSCEEVYLNGKLVGKTGEFPPYYMGYVDFERNYFVAQEDLNIEGNNLIAIKLNQGWGAGGFLSKEKLTISASETNDKLALNVAVSDSDYIFMSSNPISIKVNIENKNNWAVVGSLHVTLTTDDYQPVKSDSINIEIDGQKHYTKDFELNNPNPGFYRYTIQFKRNKELVCEKKFNVGYEAEKIDSPLDAKADFKAFWDNSLKELAKVSPNYKLTLLPESSNADYELYLVEMKSFENELIRGYYAKPKREGKHPVLVEYMGYGAGAHFPNMSWNGFAHFILSIRGQALNQPTNRFGNWITYGLENKDKYYYRGAFLDVVRALDFVCSRPEIDTDKIAVNGGSQGGALSFAAAALDKRVKVAAPNIPFLSDYPDYFKIAPWPKSDFDAYMSKHREAKWEDIYGVLSYFDIKNLAQWIECPIIMGVGVQDNVCPPHINFAAYNQVKAEKCWMAFALYGHGVSKDYTDASMKFIKEKLNVK